MTDLDCTVIGAGVVGLAIARALALAGREVLVVDTAQGIGTGTSSRNSEVIHAGIYYPRDSHKARLCVRGKKMLYQYCEERGLDFARTGKLIVAENEAQGTQLAGITERAHANGVSDLQTLTGKQARALEPALQCHAALLSPSTGIIDSHAYMLSLQGEAEHAGAQFVFHTPMESARRRDQGGFDLVLGGVDPTTLSTALLINAAGIHAPSLARRIAGLPAEQVPQDFLCKGSYFTLGGRAPFSRLIYPIPSNAGLGVHLTLDMGGQAKFGPDTQWVDQEDYTIDATRADVFYDAVRRYWPALPDGALTPGYTGIRPKISGPTKPAADFMFSGPDQHGVPGLLNLFGIESPGLTASLAIAEHCLHVLTLNTPCTTTTTS